MPGYAHAQLTPIQLACRTQLTRDGTRSMERLSGPGSASRKGNKPAGYDRYAGARLDARRRAFDAMPNDKQAAMTRPGSMQRP